MELQAFTSSGDFCFKTNPHGFVYQRMLEYLKDSPSLAFFRRLEGDFKLPGSDLAVILSGLRNEMISYMRQVRLQPQPEIPKSHLTEVIIWGEKFSLYPLSPVHGQLMQLHHLFLAINKAVEDDSDLEVFVIPNLSSIQFRLLKLLKEAPAGIENERLPEVLIREYERLMNLDIVSAELKGAFEKEALALSEGHPLAESIDFLKKWNLLREDVGGRKIVPTQKLLLVNL